MSIVTRSVGRPRRSVLISHWFSERAVDYREKAELLANKASITSWMSQHSIPYRSVFHNVCVSFRVSRDQVPPQETTQGIPKERSTDDEVLAI